MKKSQYFFEGKDNVNLIWTLHKYFFIFWVLYCPMCPREKKPIKLSILWYRIYLICDPKWIQSHYLSHLYQWKMREHFYLHMSKKSQEITSHVAHITFIQRIKYPVLWMNEDLLVIKTIKTCRYWVIFLLVDIGSGCSEKGSRAVW